MVLRKITIDNSVRAKSEQTKEKEIKPTTKKKLVYSLVNKTKKFHKTIKSFLIMFQHQDSNSLYE